MPHNPFRTASSNTKKQLHDATSSHASCTLPSSNQRWLLSTVVYLLCCRAGQHQLMSLGHCHRQHNTTRNGLKISRPRKRSMVPC